MALFSECMQLCAQIVVDIADIVRDGDFTSTTNRSEQSQDAKDRSHWKQRQCKNVTVTGRQQCSMNNQLLNNA